jgi:AbrB family looped-hinge helix DNA binding protein
MKALASVDKAGRLVIPKKIREKMHLEAGVVVEIETTGDHLEIRITENQDYKLVEKDGLLVIDGGPAVDAVAAIKADRQARIERFDRKSGS